MSCCGGCRICSNIIVWMNATQIGVGAGGAGAGGARGRGYGDRGRGDGEFFCVIHRPVD